ncbi:efflux RND transporter periplasmic adaptor subunit [Neobacillus ginsengisoli]|uniref:HlyD family secretion protein n=1 Tax=Neobacillus ginsengisoli TaxID=904295 RepID=A0ABT9XVY8_9BACI|nr:HlyD family efflux transporter periplasmic adaptor subunit [Neobacillus ginsengisoli]MDQ0199735.1 HlyD family secretion protein [Neobacillus ginsengisoli]
MKKWIITIIIVIVVGFVGYQWYGSKTSAAQQGTATQMRTAIVQKGKFEVKVSGSGTVQPVTTEDIKSTINNNSISEVLVSAGETVKKGESIITFTDGSDPITAPADGVITTIAVQAGERVSIGQAVAHLTNYTDLQTVAQVDELDIPKISIGQTVTVKVNALPDQTFTGAVTAIANEGTSTNGVSTFDVTIHINQPTGLKVGMSTESSILTASKDNALFVPVDAVHTMNGQKFVMVTSADQTNQNNQGYQNNQNNQGNQGNQNKQGNQWGANSRKFVKTGLANEDYVEITEGLTEGETVRLPNLVIGNSSTNSKMMQGGFGGFGGMGGGMGRQFRNGNGGGNKSSSGKGGN